MVVSITNYINAYNTNTDTSIEITTRVVDKNITIYHAPKGAATQRFKHVYLNLWSTLSGALPSILDLENNDLYELVDIGDIVTLKVQKGNLGSYFIIQIKVQKNNQIVNL